MTEDRVFLVRLGNNKMLVCENMLRATEIFLGYEESEDKEPRVAKVYPTKNRSGFSKMDILGFNCKEIKSKRLWRYAKKNNVSPDSERVREKLEEDN